jgi:acetyl esterase/lipase
MRLHLPIALGAGVALAGCTMSAPPPAPSAAAHLLSWPDLLNRPRPAPDHVIRYGDQPAQLADLYLPAGAGPHPVVLMIHGGCWSQPWDRNLMNWAADDLRRRGIAVWNIDYWTLGEHDRSARPMLFADVAHAADALRDQGGSYHLDLSRVVAVGHSAGGHLALWLAGRKNLPRGHYARGNPLPIHAVISLGGLPDLELAAQPPGSGCGTEVIGRLVGRGISAVPDVFADTSVPRLGPLGVPQVLINGTDDPIIPTFYAQDYAARMRAKGDDVRVRMIEHTGHVELVAPESAAWRVAVEEIEHALGRGGGR